MKRFSTLALGLMLGLGSAAMAQAGDITVVLSGVQPDRGGVIHVLAFNDKTAFEQNMFAKMVGYAKIPADAAQVSGVLKDQGAGPLAVLVHHDANDNGQFEMAGAKPLEGWSYSNGAGTTAPPSFEEAAIPFDGADGQMELKLNYAN